MKTQAKTFSQVVQAVLKDRPDGHVSTACLVRLARKHVGSNQASLIKPVIDAVRDELRIMASSEGA